MKTTRKKAKVTFTFSSDEPGSSFQCSLDGAPPSACTTPTSYKARLGRHTFSVFATDPVGNADASPATDSFNVVKKR